MIHNILAVLLGISILLMIFGGGDFFTMDKGEHWYPTTSWRRWKMFSDAMDGKIIYWGMGLFTIVCILIIFLKQIGLENI